jgi:hypothetical protein
LEEKFRHRQVAGGSDANVICGRKFIAGRAVRVSAWICAGNSVLRAPSNPIGVDFS